MALAFKKMDTSLKAKICVNTLYFATFLNKTISKMTKNKLTSVQGTKSSSDLISYMLSIVSDETFRRCYVRCFIEVSGIILRDDGFRWRNKDFI